MALKLLFLTQTYPRTPDDTSGPFIRDLARGLVAGGDSVTVLTPHAPGVRDGWLDDGVQVESFRYAPERFELLGYSRSLSSDERVRLGAAAVTPAYLLAARAAVRRRLKTGSYDLLQAHWVVPNGLAAAPLADRVPIAVGLHGSDVFMAEKPLVRNLVGRALRRVILLTGCSPELVERVCALGFDPRHSSVIPYGVDTEQFSPAPERRPVWRRKMGIPDSSPVVVSVGRMVTKKGFHLLLKVLPELLERHPQAHFVFAGSGDRLQEFRSTSEPWSDRVHFPGSVSRQPLPDLYRASDLFVLPAVHDPKGNVDGLPNVILEAMASALPVVASGISGIPMAIDDGVQGLLVPEQDGAALLAAVDRLLSDPDLGREMGREGRRRAERELTWRAVAARYHSAYMEGLERQSGAR